MKSAWPRFPSQVFFVKGTLSQAMAVAVRLGLLALPVVGWGWWTGGRTALLGRDTFANATNATIISSQRAHRPLRFSLSVVDKKGVPPSPPPPPLPGSPSGSRPANSGEELCWGWSVSFLIE